MRWQRRCIRIDRLHGTLGGADLSGRLALAFVEPRPRLQGALRVDRLDLRRWRAAADDAARPLDSEGGRWQTLALRDLARFDADLELKLDQWLGLPAEVRDLSFSVHADERGVRAPFQATVAAARVGGTIELDTAAAMPTLALQLAATGLALADPVRDGWGVAGIEGTLGQLDMHLAGRGETLGAWLQDLEASIAMHAVEAGRADASGGRPVRLRLDTVKLLARRGERLRGSARGSVLGDRVELSLRGGTLPELLRTRGLPIELQVVSEAATLRIAADLARVMSAPEAALRFDLRAPRSGALARWLGVAADSSLPVNARGHLRLSDNTWRLDATRLQLGRSELTIDAAGSRAGGGAITTATVRGPLLDVPELASLRAVTSPARTIDARGPAAPIVLPDADLQFNLDRVHLGRIDLGAVGMTARVRQGHLLPSPITVRLAGTSFTGRAEFDPRGGRPRARLEVLASDVEVGRLLRDLGVADGIDGRVDAVQLSLQGPGDSWREWAEDAAFEATMLGGKLAVRAAPRHPAFDVRVHEAVIGAAPGEPIRLRLDGQIERTPVHVELSSGTLADVTRGATQLPIVLQARAAGALLKLDGALPLPFGREGELRFELKRRAARHAERTDSHRAARLGAVVDRRSAADHDRRL